MNINTNFNRQIASPNFRAGQNVSNPVKTEEKKSLSTGTKWAIGLGLTALASYGIYAMTKGRVKPKNNPTPMDPNLTNQTEQIINAKIRNYIKNDNLIEIFEKNGILGEKLNRGASFKVHLETMRAKEYGNLIERLSKAETPEQLLSIWKKHVAENRQIPEEFLKFLDDIPEKELHDKYNILLEDVELFLKNRKISLPKKAKLSQKIKALYDIEINDCFERTQRYAERMKKMEEAMEKNNTSDIKKSFDSIMDEVKSYIEWYKPNK